MTALRTSPSPSCGPIQQGTRTPSLCSTRTASLPPPTPSTAAVSARCRVSRAVWTTTAFGSGWKSSSAGPGHSSPHPSSPPHASLPRYCAHTPRCVTDPLLLYSLQRARVAFKQPRHCSRHRSTHPSLASSLGAVSVTSSRPHPSHLPQHPPRSAFNPHVT